MTLAFSDIHAAAQRIKGGIYYSPCPSSEPLSLVAGCRIHCKLDYLQRTGSFKERGARNALMLLPAEQRKRGVIAASAGNHAQGLAYHGQQLGIPVTVVMPRYAPLVKITSCQQMGAKVILHGDTFDQTQEQVAKLAHEQGLTRIHPFDDPHVIAGQGTMGLEIVEQVPDLEAIVVPVGGGGLIAGVALAIKTLRPQVMVIGVEPERAACFTAAFAAGKPVPVTVTPTLADGLAVAQAGQLAFQIARHLIDRMVTVSERYIALAVLRLAELEHGVVEGAGASSLAACLAGAVPELKGKKVVLPLCGGNIDTTVLGRIIERGLVADGRLCRFVVRLHDRPGALAKLSALIADQGVSVKDIAHDSQFSGDDITTVNVHIVVETRNAEHIKQLRHQLKIEGFDVSFDLLDKKD